MNKKGKTASRLRILLVLFICAALVLGVCATSVVFRAGAMMAGEGRYYSDYTSMEEAQAAAAELGEELGEEGTVLLKNRNNALPLTGKEKVTVLGVSSDKVEGGSTTVADSLESAGFSVNPEFKRYYASVGTSYGSENVKDFTDTAKSSVSIYDDVAVVIFSRTGGESNDCATVTDEVEDNKYGTKDQGWKHKALKTETTGTGTDAKTVEYKHYLQLTDSEEELLEYAKANCKKVVVLINSSNVMELGNIQNDDEIDAVLWTGRPGADGLKALGNILNGKVNPSGKQVDIWPADLTADPTWYGYGKGEQYATAESDPVYDEDGTMTDPGHELQEGEYPETFFRKAIKNAQGEVTGSEIYDRQNPNMQADIPGVSTGYSFTMYSEDIYMGYRYYETVAAEIELGHLTYTDGVLAKADANADGAEQAEAWYNDAVVYPFGYGLSYTTFGWENVTPAENVQNWQTKETIDLQVTVTNTGNYAGKDVVQVYAHAPYFTDGIAKSEVSLVGFGKTSLLAPGASETLTITVNVQDIASFDWNDDNGNDETTYELDDGSGYELRFQSDSHNVKATQALSDLSEDVILGEDDFSGAEVKALFSGDDEYNLLGWDPAANNGEGGKGATLVEEGKMTLLDRDDFVGTHPAPLEAEKLVRSDEWFEFHENLDQYNAETQQIYQEKEDGSSEYGWVKTAADTYNNKYKWTQAASHAADYSDVTVKLADMAGIDRNDDTTQLGEGAPFGAKTGREAWTKFMNQLTWDELVTLASNAGWGTPEIESIEKPSTTDQDSPNNLASTYNWGDECHIAATWNTDLAHKEGIIMGNLAMHKGVTWYGPAMNTHRSPFGGRCNEYYSQDGYHGGMIGAAVISGAQSKGVICYVKHCAMNDQEIYRMNLMTLATEQAAREIYFKQFQIAIQEGGCQALMTTYGSIGEYSGATNYNFMTALIRDEWGFDGYAVTDAWMPCKDYWPLDMLVRAGCDAPLENAGARTMDYEAYKDAIAADPDAEVAYETYLLSGTYDSVENKVYINRYTGRDATTGMPTGTATKTESNTQWYSVRMCAERILYTQANANVIKNGYDMSGFTGKTLTAGTQGVEYSANIGVQLDSDNVSYTVSGGSLPAGLSMNDSGVISGTPETPGTYNFNVELIADNWITSSASYSITIASAFSVDADVSAMKVGEAFDGYIESDVVTLDEYDTITYEVTSGSMPAGITLNGEEGRFTGTPTEAGTFSFTVLVKAEKESEGGGTKGGPKGDSGPKGGPSTETSEFEYAVTMIVTGESVSEIDALIARIEALEAAVGDADISDELTSIKTDLEALKGSGVSSEDIEALETRIAALEENGGCGSAAGGTMAIVGSAIALAGIVFAIAAKRRKEN